MAIDLKGRWEGATPRERRLVAALAGVFVLCIFGLIWRVVGSRLDALATKNAENREALRLLDQHREALAQPRSGKAAILAALERPAPQVGTYLEEIAKDLNVQIAESSDRPAAARGKYTERTTDVTLRGITLAELSELLRRVETNSQQVVAQRLVIVKNKFGAEDKLERVELTIATYEKTKEKAKKDDGGAKDDGDGEGAGGEGDKKKDDEKATEGGT